MESHDADTNGTTEFLLAPSWAAYEVVDDRRRRSFYFLLTTTIIFGLLWLTQPASFALPFLNTEVSFFIAMASSPAFILVFTGSYYYLSCHTVVNYVRWLNLFWDNHAVSIKALDLSFVGLHAALKKRDVTETLNIFLMFTPGSDVYDASLPKLVQMVKEVLANLIRIANVLLPPAVYAGIITWL